MREVRVEKYLKTLVEKHGGICLKWVSPGCRGVPDRIVFFQGAVFFIELKAPHGYLSTSQSRMHEVLRDRGHDVIVLNTKEKVKLWVELQVSVLNRAVSETWEAK